MPPLLCSLLLALPAQTPTRPNVVLVIGDDIAVADIVRTSTPNLDTLASAGVRFTSAYANPTCSPTRRTIMFGTWHGAESGSVCAPATASAPPAGTPSLPRLMQSGGYKTALFGKWHVGPNPDGPWETAPQSHGFDTWRAGLAMNVKQCGSQDYSDWIRADDGVSRHTTEHNTIAIRDAFIDWWTTTEGPRFAVVAYQAAHTPFNAPPASILPPDYPSPLSARQRFDSIVASLDFVVGEMLAVVDLDDTWFIFVGDNGTPGIVAPHADRAKTSTFERGIHVPLLVAHSSLEPAETPALVHTVDLMATIADLAGLDLPGPVDSRSFAPCLSDPEFVPRDWIYCQAEAYDDRCLRTSRYKLRVADGVEEFYDLELDRSERHPLGLRTAEQSAARDELRRILKSLQRSR